MGLDGAQLCPPEPGVSKRRNRTSAAHSTDTAAGTSRVRPRVLCGIVHRGGVVTRPLKGGAGKAMAVSVTPCDKDSPGAGFEDRGTVHRSWGARARTHSPASPPSPPEGGSSADASLSAP